MNLRRHYGLLCVTFTALAVIPPFDYLSRVDVVLAVIAGLLTVCAKDQP